MDFNEVLALFIRRRWVVIAVFATTFMGHVAVLVVQPEVFGSEALITVRERDASEWADSTLGSLRLFEPFNVQILNKLMLDKNFRKHINNSLKKGKQ